MSVSASPSLSEVQASGGPAISFLHILEYEGFVVNKAEQESLMEPPGRLASEEDLGLVGESPPCPHPQHDLRHPLQRVSSRLLRADRRSVWLTAIALVLTASPTVGIQ